MTKRWLLVASLTLGVLGIAQGESSGKAIEWTEMNARSDEFAAVFPDTYNPSYQLTTFEGQNAPYTIGLTVREGFQAPVPLLKGRRGLYGTQEAPVFRFNLEAMTPAQYAINRETMAQSLHHLTQTGLFDETSGVYQNYDYMVVARKDRTYEALKGKNIVDVAYIFFPDARYVVNIFTFNTKQSSDEAQLVDVESVVHQAIDQHLAGK